MNKFLKVLGYASGYSFITAGAKMMEQDRKIRDLESPATRQKLAEQIYLDSIARGDPEYMASFYKSDTEYPDDLEKISTTVFALIGLGSICLGACIVLVWALLFHHLFMR